MIIVGTWLNVFVRSEFAAQEIVLFNEGNFEIALSKPQRRTETCNTCADDNDLRSLGIRHVILPS